jgi:hypothetical protein
MRKTPVGAIERTHLRTQQDDTTVVMVTQL